MKTKRGLYIYINGFLKRLLIKNSSLSSNKKSMLLAKEQETVRFYFFEHIYNIGMIEGKVAFGKNKRAHHDFRTSSYYLREQEDRFLQVKWSK